MYFKKEISFIHPFVRIILQHYSCLLYLPFGIMKHAAFCSIKGNELIRKILIY